MNRLSEGIKLLDRSVKEWRKIIDPVTLDMGDTKLCILGQLFGSYNRGLTHLNLALNDGETMGFYINLNSFYEVKNKERLLILLSNAWYDEVISQR